MSVNTVPSAAANTAPASRHAASANSGQPSGEPNFSQTLAKSRAAAHDSQTHERAATQSQAKQTKSDSAQHAAQDTARTGNTDKTSAAQRESDSRAATPSDDEQTTARSKNSDRAKNSGQRGSGETAAADKTAPTSANASKHAETPALATTRTPPGQATPDTPSGHASGARPHRQSGAAGETHLPASGQQARQSGDHAHITHTQLTRRAGAPAPEAANDTATARPQDTTAQQTHGAKLAAAGPTGESERSASSEAGQHQASAHTTDSQRSKSKQSGAADKTKAGGDDATNPPAGGAALASGGAATNTNATTAGTSERRVRADNNTTSGSQAGGQRQANTNTADAKTQATNRIADELAQAKAGDAKHADQKHNAEMFLNTRNTRASHTPGQTPGATPSNTAHTTIGPTLAPGTAAGAQATSAAAPAPAPTFSAALQQPVGTDAWNQAVTRQSLRISHNGGGKAELTLNPANLGKLHVSMDMNQQQPQIHFVSPHADVRAAVQSALPQLRDAFTEAGIDLGQTSVGEGSQQHDDSDTNSRRGAQPGARALGASDDMPATPAGMQVTSITGRTMSGGIDIFA